MSFHEIVIAISLETQFRNDYNATAGHVPRRVDWWYHVRKGGNPLDLLGY